jgi:hypothetical protein
MNANELADRLDYINRGEKTLDEAAIMLRQQQAEIEALKAELKLIDELVRGKYEQ